MTIQASRPSSNSLSCFCGIVCCVIFFFESDKLESSKNYKAWKRHMESTLIYNELWKEICNGDVKETKPIDTTSLAKWELKDEKALALCYLKTKKCMFTLKMPLMHGLDGKHLRICLTLTSETKRVEFRLKLLQQKLSEGGDVLEYIS